MVTKANKKRQFIAMSPKQREFHTSDEWITALITGVGFGKSRAGITRILLTANNDETWLAVSPSYVMLRRNYMPLAMKVARDLGVLIKTTSSPFPILTFKIQDGGQAEMYMASGENPESLRGANLDGIHLDECAIMSEMVFKICIQRLRGIRGQVGPVLITTTPKGRKNWVFELFYEKVAFIPKSPEAAKELGVVQIGPSWYKPKPKTKLIQAGSWENPFISEDYYHNVKSMYSEAFASQELEGCFLEQLGTLISRTWFANKIRDAAPREARRARYWDLAATDMGGAYTCGTLVAINHQNQIFVEDVVRGQWSSLTRGFMIESTAEADSRKYNNEVNQVVEQEPGSGGKEQAQQMIRMLSGKPVFRDLPSHGQATRTQDGEKLPGNAKITRAQPLIAQMEAGNVYMIRGEWNDEWLSELCGFPEMKYCDQVDSVSAGFNFLQKSMVADPGEIGTVRGVSTVPSKYGVTVADVGLDLPTFFKGR